MCHLQSKIKKGTHGILCVKHEGEILCSFSKKWPNAVLRCPFIIGYELSYFLLTIYESKERKILDKFVDALEKDEDVMFFEIIERNEYGGMALICKRSYGVLKALYDTKSVFRGPFLIRNGIKYFPIVTYSSPKEVEKKVKEYSPKNTNAWFKLETTINTTSHETYSVIQSIINKLTDAEKKALIAAYELGYFKWPKIHNSSDISKYLNISRTTFLEHLRKAEEKIIGFLYKYMDK